jgi:hypothetical protein
LFGKGLTDLFSSGNGAGSKIPVIGLGHFQGPLKRLLHLGAKPVFHAVGDKTYGYQKKENGWNKGKADKGYHQFGSELGSQDFPLSLKDQFDKIPDDQKDQEENQDDVDIDQAEDDDIVRNGDFPPDLWEFHLNGRKDKDEDGDDPNDDQLISSSSCIRGKFFIHTPSIPES